MIVVCAAWLAHYFDVKPLQRLTQMARGVGSPFSPSASSDGVSQWPADSPVLVDCWNSSSPLKQKAEAVTREELEDPKEPMESLANRMLDAMRLTNGAAIAANQIGTLKRVVVISIPPERIAQEESGEGATTVMAPAVLVNPEIWPLDNKGRRASEAGAEPPDMSTQPESCLSVPRKAVSVSRWEHIGWRYQRLDGVLVTGKARGRLAKLLQHEVDHLEGICMSDRGEETQDEADVRSDALGPIRSTEHWDLMKAPGYHLRTSVLPGAKVLD